MVDHIGFSFQDLDAKMTEFKAAGIKVLAEPRQVMDFKFALNPFPLTHYFRETLQSLQTCP